MAGPGPVVDGADILREESVDVMVKYKYRLRLDVCVLVTADISKSHYWGLV